MTLVSIDLKNAGYETGPDDRVVFYSPANRNEQGTIISTAETSVPLVDGQAEKELAPGPVVVQILAQGVTDTRPKTGYVPDLPDPVSLWDVVLDWTPALVDQGILAILAAFDNTIPAIEGARDEALGQVSGAVAAELNHFEERLVPLAESPVNLVDPSAAVTGLLAPDGTVSPHAVNLVTGWIPVMPGAQYVSWSWMTYAGGGHRVIFYNDAQIAITGTDTSYKPGQTVHHWTAPSSAAWVRIGVSPIPTSSPPPLDEALIFQEGIALWDPDAPLDRSWWDDKITPPHTPIRVDDLNFAVDGKIPYSMILMSEADQQALSSLIAEHVRIAIDERTGTDLVYPSGFASVPIQLRQAIDGRITHDHDFAQYRDAPTHIYFDSRVGVSGGGSESSPFRTWIEVVTAVNGTAGDVVVHVRSPFSNRNYATTSAGPLIADGRRVSILGEASTGVSWLTTANAALSWTQDGTVWSAPRSSVRAVFKADVDEHGVPVPLHSAATLTECRSTIDSWHSDEATVWVNSTSMPTVESHHVCIAATLAGDTTIKNGGTVYMENLGLLTTLETKVSGDSTGTLVMNGVKIAGGDLRPQTTGLYGNGLSVTDVSTTMLFDTVAAHSTRDGFNYHYANTPLEMRRSMLAFEYDCLAYGCGPYNTEGNNNATTAHEGISMLRVGTRGWDTSGPALADVGGCLSVNYACDMTGGTRNYVFEAGEAWLHDCISRSPVIDHVLLTQDAILHGEPIIR